jgi:hypothetical protein
MIKAPKVKHIVFWCVLLCGVMVTIELVALGAYRIAFGESFSYQRLQALRRAAQEMVRTEFPFVIHPYYGYVFDPRLGGANKDGFFGRENHIQPADPKKVVIAIIGGSVAVHFASDDRARDVLKSELKTIGVFQDRDIVILNLANLAYKEPQGLLVINDILSRGGHLDLVIALDGFNEIALPEAFGNVGNGISPFYPMQWWRFAMESTLEARVGLASVFSKPILRHLVTANFIWRVADAYLAKADVNAGRPADPTTRLSNDRRIFLGPDAQYATRRDLYTDVVVQWGRASVLLNNIMAAQGGFYFHFLQPNQYVVGSKPLTEHESDAAINPASRFREPVEIGYPYLRVMGESLRDAGVWFEDLTAVFKDVHQQVYVDKCCHVNEEGNALLAKTIATAVATRLSNPTPSANRAIAFDQVDIDSSLFANGRLRRFASKSPDYRDGSDDRVGPAKNEQGVETALTPSRKRVKEP